MKDGTLMIRGDTGTGKTLLCLQYLYKGATESNEPGVFISFAESKEAIVRHGETFAWDFEKLMEQNKFAVICYEPHEVASIMENGGGTIRDTVEDIGAKRLVIDPLSAYRLAFDDEYRASESILALFKLLKKWNITTIVTSEYPVNIRRPTGDRLESLTDGIINLYYTRNKSTKSRSLEIIKMRDTAHDDNINSFVISKSGLQLKKG